MPQDDKPAVVVCSLSQHLNIVAADVWVAKMDVDSHDVRASASICPSRASRLHLVIDANNR